MSVEFTTDRVKRFEQIVTKYEERRSALLPTLYLAQEQWGYLSDETLRYVARLLEMPPREVFEAASFYILFHLKKRGRYCLQICNNITCTMMGSEKILSTLSRELGVGLGQETPDGLFSLLSVQCLGACDVAPVVQVNEEYFEKMTEEKATRLVGGLRSSQPVEALQGVLS